MNNHEFLHEMAMIHASIRKVLKQLPIELFKKQREELISVKHTIESFIVTPDQVLTEKEK